MVWAQGNGGLGLLRGLWDSEVSMGWSSKFKGWWGSRGGV